MKPIKVETRSTVADHLRAAHGWTLTLCTACQGINPRCIACDGDGVLLTYSNREACGPECPLSKSKGAA